MIKDYRAINQGNLEKSSTAPVECSQPKSPHLYHLAEGSSLVGKVLNDIVDQLNEIKSQIDGIEKGILGINNSTHIIEKRDKREYWRY